MCLHSANKAKINYLYLCSFVELQKSSVTELSHAPSSDLGHATRAEGFKHQCGLNVIPANKISN